MSQPHRHALRRLAPAILACSLALPAAAAELAPISRVEPEFPREASAVDAHEGKVKARLTIDGSGEVSRVEIVEAVPRRIFDRAVVKALSQWRFAAGAANRAFEVDIVFKR